MSEKPDETADDDAWGINGREIMATLGLVLATITAAMMVPVIRERLAELLSRRAE